MDTLLKQTLCFSIALWRIPHKTNHHMISLSSSKKSDLNINHPTFTIQVLDHNMSSLFLHDIVKQASSLHLDHHSSSSSNRGSSRARSLSNVVSRVVGWRWHAMSDLLKSWVECKSILIAIIILLFIWNLYNWFLLLFIIFHTSFRKHLLLNVWSEIWICYEDFQFLRRLFMGCIYFRRPRQKGLSLDASNKLKASFRSRFLKFLWGLWFSVVPNISEDAPRIIQNVETRLSNSSENNELFFMVVILST